MKYLSRPRVRNACVEVRPIAWEAQTVRKLRLN